MGYVNDQVEAERAAAQALLNCACDYSYDGDDDELIAAAKAYRDARLSREEAEIMRRRRYYYKGDEKSKAQCIYEYIKKHPGCYTYQIERDTGIPATCIRPAAYYLRKQGFVAPYASETRGRYYPAKRNT